MDGLRVSFGRQTGEFRGFRRATERARRSGQGLTTVVMFVLVPQVKLSRRLKVARPVPQMIVYLIQAVLS